MTKSSSSRCRVPFRPSKAMCLLVSDAYESEAMIVFRTPWRRSSPFQRAALDAVMYFKRGDYGAAEDSLDRLLAIPGGGQWIGFCSVVWEACETHG